MRWNAIFEELMQLARQRDGTVGGFTSSLGDLQLVEIPHPSAGLCCLENFDPSGVLIESTLTYHLIMWYPVAAHGWILPRAVGVVLQPSCYSGHFLTLRTLSPLSPQWLAPQTWCSNHAYAPSLKRSLRTTNLVIGSMTEQSRL